MLVDVWGGGGAGGLMESPSHPHFSSQAMQAGFPSSLLDALHGPFRTLPRSGRSTLTIILHVVQYVHILAYL